MLKLNYEPLVIVIHIHNIYYFIVLVNQYILTFIILQFFKEFKEKEFKKLNLSLISKIQDQIFENHF